MLAGYHFDRGISFVIWPLLIIYLAFLLVSTYVAQQDLINASSKENKFKLERKVTALGYFYSERSDDLNNLSKTKAIEAYFANQALGMSMDYGLRASLFNLRSQLDNLIKEKKLTGNPVTCGCQLLIRKIKYWLM